MQEESFWSGAGLGDPKLLTLREGVPRAGRCGLVATICQRSIVAAYGPQAERLYVGRRGRGQYRDQLEINRPDRSCALGKCVVRLKGGDPSSLGGGEAEAVAAAGLEFEVVPGVMAAVAAPALRVFLSRTAPWCRP